MRSGTGRRGLPVVAGLGAVAGGTLGFIADNIPGAIAGGRLGYRLGHMAATHGKRPREEDDVDDPPPKKKGFFRKVWDNGGKHLAAAAGAAAGAYAVGKGAEYLDRRTGGRYSTAIGRSADSLREALGRRPTPATAPAPVPAAHVPAAARANPNQASTTFRTNDAAYRRGAALRDRATDAEDLLVAQDTLHRPTPHERLQMGRTVLDGPPQKTLFVNPYADPEDLVPLGPPGTTLRTQSLRPSSLPPDGSTVRQIGQFGNPTTVRPLPGRSRPTPAEPVPEDVHPDLVAWATEMRRKRGL
jgi:hypothetical protein